MDEQQGRDGLLPEREGDVSGNVHAAMTGHEVEEEDAVRPEGAVREFPNPVLLTVSRRLRFHRFEQFALNLKDNNKHI